MAVTNRYGGEEVTHTLLAESRAEAQRWMEAFWQHFYDMSERGRGRRSGTPQPGGTPNPTGRSRGGADPYPVPPGQWKQCCDELMRIEVPPPRRPPAMLPRQGSLYHEMGERWGRGGLGGLCLCLLPFCSPLTFCQAAPSSPPWHLPNVAVLSTASLSPPSLSLSPPPPPCPHSCLPLSSPAFLCPCCLSVSSPHLSVPPSPVAPALPGPAVPPSACEGLLLQDNAVSAEIRALLSSYYSDR